MKKISFVFEGLDSTVLTDLPADIFPCTYLLVSNELTGSDAVARSDDYIDGTDGDEYCRAFIAAALAAGEQWQPVAPYYSADYRDKALWHAALDAANLDFAPDYSGLN